MKCIFDVLVIASLILGSLNASSKTSDVDAFQSCLNRTKQDRLNCEAGCGMIIQQCYDEGIENANREIGLLISDLKSENGDMCANFAAMYLDDASRMEKEVVKKTDSLPGWVGSVMRLNFARQRLDNVKSIRETCKQ